MYKSHNSHFYYCVLAATACKPNPCQSGGKCTDLGFKKFTCDCSGTGYIGSTCGQGVIGKPKYPQLIVKKQSEPLSFTAHPDNEIKITPVVKGGEVLFQPSVVTITYPQTVGYFKVTAKKGGLFKVQYKISGVSALSFIQPTHDVIYAHIKKAATKPVSITVDFYKNGCKTRHLGSCGGSKRTQLSSTCAFTPTSAGFVSVTGPGVTFPLSVVGILSGTLNAIYNNGIVSPNVETDNYLKTGQLPQCPSWSKCPKHQLDSDAINFIISNNMFSRGYYNSLNNLLPFWMKLRVARGKTSFNPRNIKSSVSRGRQLKTINACKAISFKDTAWYSQFSPTISTNIEMLSTTKNIKDDTPLCIAVDTCRKTSHFVFPINAKLSLTDIFSSSGVTGLSIYLNGFHFSSNFQNTCILLREEFITKNVCFKPDSQWDVSGEFKSQVPTANVIFSGKANVKFGNMTEVTNLLYISYIIFYLKVNKTHFKGERIRPSFIAVFIFDFLIYAACQKGFYLELAQWLSSREVWIRVLIIGSVHDDIHCINRCTA